MNHMLSSYITLSFMIAIFVQILLDKLPYLLETLYIYIFFILYKCEHILSIVKCIYIYVTM
jgi:hypothetical protein